MLHTSRGEDRRAGARSPFEAIAEADDLALEDVDELVVRMRVQRRRLPAHEGILEREERAVRLLGSNLPLMDAAAVEPTQLALAATPDDLLSWY